MMGNSFFRFKQFTIQQANSAMKVTTDACLFAAWLSEKIKMQHKTSATVLDIGAGTCLLSLMLAQKCPQLQIDAVELDEAAAVQATENVMASNWHKNIRLLQTNIKEFATATTRKYDFIIVNPPFYENDLPSFSLQKNRAHHSNDLLLHELVGLIHFFLAPGASFFLLFPYKRKDELEKLLFKNNLQATELISVKQSTTHSFFRGMMMGSLLRDETKTAHSAISIKDEQQNYTTEFVELLKDYYLYL